jgi:stage 0 sporulation regulatory protein
VEGEKMASKVLKSELIVNIEAKRKEMIEVAKVGGYTSEKAIKCSQELDMYLNKYLQVLLEEEKYTDGPFLEFVKTMKKWTFQDLQFL